jgi:site-specific DNA-methyltransferase (adenine-specific)
MSDKERAPRNRTLTLDEAERRTLGSRLGRLHTPAPWGDVRDATLCQDAFEALDLLPDKAYRLVFADPPYNLTKSYMQSTFHRRDPGAYEAWLETWIAKLPRLMTSDASIYVCAEWSSSASVQRVLERYFHVRNRVTWEREKGRGARGNWKNAAEDVWFATLSDDYVFNLDAVKIKRRVRAPYTDAAGLAKDWTEDKDGRHRLTHPSNLWTDLTVPFWSMRENTDHPTQKPEKMLARIILASTNPGDAVLDPFLGSGTCSVAAKKLGRRYTGIEREREYCLIAEKRLLLAEGAREIQGLRDGCFTDRNEGPKRAAAALGTRGGESLDSARIFPQDALSF